MEAMRVPRPPRLTPTRRFSPFSVNSERSSAAAAKAARAQRQYEELRDFYQVKPTIDQLHP